MKQIMAAAVLLSCAVALGAQEAGLALVNGEGLWLYYAVDPVLENSSAETESFTVLTHLRFKALAPGGASLMPDVRPGRHAVIGFWTAANADDFGVFRITLDVAERRTTTYTLKKTGALAALDNKKREVMAVLPSTPIVIDNRYDDWSGYPAIAVFTPAVAPAQFTYQAADGVRNLPIRNSVYWGRAGTQLLSMKGLVSGETLSLCFTGASDFSSGLSIYLYLFDDRKTQEINTYTIEWPVADVTAGGNILLWKRGEKEPVTIGAFRASGVSLEGAITLGALPQDLRRNLVNKYSFDLKTGFHEQGKDFYEEFFFTSRLFNDLYVRP